MKKSEKLLEEIREDFEELFPKDQEAIDGIRPSKSHRSEALVLYGKFMNIIRVIEEEHKHEIKRLTDLHNQ